MMTFQLCLVKLLLFYRQVAAHMKELDRTRPITLADYRHTNEDLVVSNFKPLNQ